MSARGLSVRGLTTRLSTEDGEVRAVTDVSFDLSPGEIVGLVGESGSGKSLTALSLLGLLPRGGRITSGSVRLDGRELVGLDDAELRRVRGRQIAMIFQDPMTSLNPYLTVGEQVGEPARLHRGFGARDAHRLAVSLLEQVGVPEPERRARGFPHELSGGMRQRAMIAMALAGEPSVLLADEPTTALDVTIQAQVLALLASLCRERSLAVLLVTHDLGVVSMTTNRTLVMYAGRIVEGGPTGEVLRSPRHPYTRALLRSVPRVEQRGLRLEVIGGLSPRLTGEEPDGCSFRPRCGEARTTCATGQPPRVELPGREHRCVLAGGAPP
ncbi:MAG: ABC transporter ATP-binding protein [Deltaproteobacteria bacterium]|nr:ABC transporter ATP-binding protein [Deltaproteobacteria bacterium]